MDQTKIEKSLNEREEDPVTDSGLVASLTFFEGEEDPYASSWLRALERVQGVTIPDESDGDPELRNFLESIFNSPESFNILVETAFLVHKVELVKGKVSLDAMQIYATRFAATLDDWVPRFPDSNDRALNERLVSYFYKGIEPEPLRLLVQYFRVDHVSDLFHQFRVQCTASVVEMVSETVNFAPDSRSKSQSQAGHWAESAEPRKRTQREPKLMLFRRNLYFQFLIAKIVAGPINQ